MRLHACDAHLEGARLDLQQGDAAAAGKHVAVARKLVAETGYKRREREWAWLELPSPPAPIGANLGRRKGRRGFFILSPRDRGSRTRRESSEELSWFSAPVCLRAVTAHLHAATVYLHADDRAPVRGVWVQARDHRAPVRGDPRAGTQGPCTCTRCLCACTP